MERWKGTLPNVIGPEKGELNYIIERFKRKFLSRLNEIQILCTQFSSVQYDLLPSLVEGSTKTFGGEFEFTSEEFQKKTFETKTGPNSR